MVQLKSRKAKYALFDMVIRERPQKVFFAQRRMWDERGRAHRKIRGPAQTIPTRAPRQWLLF